MTIRPLAGLALGMLCGLAALTGCGSRGLSGEKLPVVGTVSLDGQPVAFAVVEFSRDAEEGQIQSAVVREGRFSLDGRVGLPAGTYSVAVVPYVPEVEEISALPAKERTRIAAAQKLLPEHYQKRGMLTAAVESGKTNEITLKLDSKPQ